MSETVEDVLKRFQMGSERFVQGLSIRDGFVSVQGEALIAMASELASLREQLQAAERFKAYTHKRLDELGVPHEVPESEHTKAGCRVGGRFDVGQLKAIFDQLAASEERARKLEGDKYKVAKSLIGVLRMAKQLSQDNALILRGDDYQTTLSIRAILVAQINLLQTGSTLGDEAMLLSPEDSDAK
jgi:hypothetical protein